jgi:hypothetical protein
MLQARSAGKIHEANTLHKFYMENTLLRVSGALFCHDAKRASIRTDEIELNRGVADKHISIRPDPRLGQPGPLAHKVFVALIRKHSAYGRPAPKEISFTRREIGRLIGRKEWGGKDSEQLSRALHEIHYTFIKTQFKERNGRFVEHSFNIFPEIRVERREFASDPIEACTLTLAEPIVASLRDDHFTCLNHGLMEQFGTIGQALYMRLFFHFANLFDGNKKRELSFPKRYDDICVEWLGGLTILQHRSKIIGEQLGPHLDKLVATGFLAGYAINKAKSRGGFVIIMRPGAIFFDDYERFYRKSKRNTSQVEVHGERREVAEPLRVAYLFAEKRTGQPVTSVAFVPSKDVETARRFLAEIPFAEIERFIDYGLAEAARTNFNIQTLGGLKQYLGSYLRLKALHTASSVAEERRTSEDYGMRERYAIYMTSRRSATEKIYEALSVAEKEEIRVLAAAKASGFSGSLQAYMIDFHTGRLTAERHGQPIQTFDEWRADLTA